MHYIGKGTISIIDAATGQSKRLADFHDIEVETQKPKYRMTFFRHGAGSSTRRAGLKNRQKILFQNRRGRVEMLVDENNPLVRITPLVKAPNVK